MATVHSLASNITQKAKAALGAYKQFIVDAVTGAEPDPEEAMAVAMKAGRTTHQLAADINLVSVRHEQTEKKQSRDDDATREKLKLEYLEAHNKGEELKVEMARVQAELIKTNELASSKMHQRTAFENAVKEADNAYAKLMRESSDGSPNIYDPLNFKLS